MKIVRRVVAILGALLLTFSIAGTASAGTYYYVGSTGNKYVAIHPQSYSPTGRYIGTVQQAGSFYYGTCIGTSTACSEMLTGNSSKLIWQPCVGFTDILPRCNFPNASFNTYRVQLIDDYGSIAHADLSGAYGPGIFADDANSDPTGAYHYIMPHVTSLGNIDFISDGGASYPMTTYHDSGTYGFTTQVPLTWHPKLCFISSVRPDVVNDGSTRWLYSTCAPLTVH